MKIYTRTGDRGETSLHGGKRLPKDALRIETYGAVDELNALLGVCRALNADRDSGLLIEELQNDLFMLGADLATPAGGKPIRRVGAGDVARLERHIDAIDGTLEPLARFILPGGSPAAAYAHFARTVCRRAERLAVRLAREESVGEHAVIYLNRLSDLLFVAARRMNKAAGERETEWHGDAP